MFCITCKNNVVLAHDRKQCISPDKFVKNYIFTMFFFVCIFLNVRN